jgi:hypothetical protein
LPICYTRVPFVIKLLIISFPDVRPQIFLAERDTLLIAYTVIYFLS